MLKIGYNSLNKKVPPSCNSEKPSNLVTDSEINKRKSTVTECKNNVKEGLDGDRHQVLFKNSVTQSLPDCVVAKSKIQDIDVDDSSDGLHKENSSVQQSPWFRTWPERCDKFKSNESTLSSQNTQVKRKSCDIVETGIVRNKVTLSEALQNISLAYSPITKQLHLVENLGDTVEKCEDVEGLGHSREKKGHKRNPTGSFSSTISSLSEVSSSGSLLDGDEKSLRSLDIYKGGDQKHSLTSFFSRNVFSSFKSNPNVSSSKVWKLFGKTSKSNCSNSPHQVPHITSTALIQHPRPSNLPAKAHNEEQRHREEYKAMIAAAKKKEAQNNLARQKLQKLQLQQEEHQAIAAKYFVKNVLPNWECMRSAKQTRDLWWQGLPSSVRGKVWRLAIGNELNLTFQLYEICLSRAQTRLNSPAPSQSDLEQDQESSMDVIRLDISRTFPHLCIFQEGGPYSHILHSLLAAYVCYRPDVGYVQGMSYIAAILILNMEPFDAFVCFANLLNQPLHLSAFTLNQTQMEAYYNAYNEIFSYNLPKLYQHFQKAKLTPDLYLLDWIYTIFSKAMPLDVACRIWDVFLRDGCEFIFRTALGILHLNQDSLIDMDFLHGAQFLTRLPDDISTNELFKSIQSLTTNIGKLTFSQIVDKYSLSSR